MYEIEQRERYIMHCKIAWA